MTGDHADAVSFITARLDEKEARVHREGTPPNGVIAWLTYLRPDGSMGYTTVASGDAEGGYWVADGRELAPPASVLVVHDPVRVLREVAALRAVLADHAADDHWCARPPDPDWKVTEAGETVARTWPCGTVLDLVRIWPEHPDCDPVWKP